MTQLQKIIKYLALAFAFFLIFSVLSLFMYVLPVITSVFDKDELQELEPNITTNSSILDIEVFSSNIIFEVGDNLNVLTSNNDIEIKRYNNKLFISEKKRNWFSKKSDSDLVIYIPTNFIFDEVSIESGAGRIEVHSLTTRKLELELGAGEVQISNLSVLDNASINGDAGKLSIINSSIHNLELDMGIGELDLHSELIGLSNVDAGIGKVTLNLLGSDYKIKVDKGIGNATINGEKVKEDTNYGNGHNILNINGGIGNISVSYMN